MSQWTRKLSVLAIAAAGMVGTGCSMNSKNVQTMGDPQYRPKLLLRVGDDCNTPDGMRLAKNGDMMVSCPNFNEKQYPGKLMKITPDNKWELVCMLPAHPDTGYACPMGSDFGPDGNLYVADNQYFYNKDYKSRVLRVVMQDGKAVRTEVAVEGFKLANAVMFKGDEMFVSDTFFDRKDKPGMSGVYRIGMDEMKKGVVKLLPKEQAEKDPHFVMEMHTKRIFERGDWAGADGLTFDAKGNLYCGTFGDGTLWKATFDADGSVKSTELFVYDGRWTCCDGIFYDKKRDCIFVTDSEKNAVHVIWLPDGKFTTLWENGDTDGSDGLLDQPCEPALRGDQLILVNFDMPFPGLKNSKYDKWHTISVIDVSKLQRP